MYILIPAYQPDEKLINLIHQLNEKCDYKIVIVDDGSGKKYAHIFMEAENLGCTVISYFPNMGKGVALKTGFLYINDLASGERVGEPDGVVCADCDGQHRVSDIIRIAEKTGQSKNTIVLGSRKFIGKVPVKSLLGNRLTSLTFFLATGIRISDTQTGLRGYSMDMLPWLSALKGSHYEYELNILLEAKKSNLTLREIEIDTIYLENNKSSHFRPFVDSVRIYLPLIKFGISSLTAGLIDFLALLILQQFTGNLLFSVVTARVCSSIINFTANRFYVFDNQPNHTTGRSAVRYFSLVLFILGCNYGLMYFFTSVLNINLVLAKIMTETMLFVVSYQMQKLFVFSHKEKHSVT
jgi:putative flippase GtrA